MLSPNEFGAGTLSEAKPLSLILPYTKYGEALIVCTFEEKPYAIFLSGQFLYHGISSYDNKNYSGIIISSISIEVDEQSAYDINYYYPRAGTVIRENDELLIGFNVERATRPHKAVLISGLPNCTGKVWFTRCQIKFGCMDTKRILFSIDTSKLIEERS